VLFGTTALLFLWRARRTQGLADWTGYAGCMTVAVLTHTTAPVFLAVAWTWALLGHRRASLLRPLLRPLLLASVAVVLISAPFYHVIASAVAQATGTHSPARPITGLEIPYTFFTSVVGYSFGPSTREIQNLGPAAALRSHPVESAIGAVVAAALLWIMLLGSAPGRRYLLTLWLLPIAAMLLGSATSGKAYEARYALAGTVGHCGLAAAALCRLPGRLRAPAIGAVLTVCVWADGQWYVTPRYWKDDSRAVVSWLVSRLPPGSTVATAPGYVAGVLSHYAGMQHAPIRFISDDSLPDSARPAALLLTRLHHVADPRTVRERFRRLSGPGVHEANVGGYEILSRPGEPARKSGP
jgi:hypothetical protein